MQIGNKMRAGALITLAFFLMMLTSLFTIGLSKSKAKSEAKKTEISKKEKPVQEKRPETKKDKIKAKKDKTKSEKKESLVDPKEINQPDLAEEQKPVIKDTNVKNDIEQDHHIATWYDLHGRKTTSGQRMHRDSATAAYNHAPLGTLLLVTNTQNNKSCVVKVTDRMGHKTKKAKYIDLSKAAFGFLSHHGAGRITVTIKHL